MKRCSYVSENNIPCHNYFAEKDEDDVLCPIHKGIISVSVAAKSNSENKARFLEVINAEELLIVNMTDDELDVHIAQREAIIEKQRALLIADRAHRSERLQKLTDEERAERRKIKYVETPKGTVEKKTPKDPKNEALEKIVKLLMKNGFPENVARERAATMMPKI